MFKALNGTVFYTHVCSQVFCLSVKGVHKIPAEENDQIYDEKKAQNSEKVSIFDNLKRRYDIMIHLQKLGFFPQRGNIE